SSGIKGSKFFLITASMFLTYGPKSTPCVSVRTSTPVGLLNAAACFVSPDVDGDEVDEPAALLWPTRFRELNKRPAALSTPTDNPIRAFTTEPFIQRLLSNILVHIRATKLNHDPHPSLSVSSVQKSVLSLLPTLAKILTRIPPHPLNN